MQASQQREYKKIKPPKVCVATGEIIDNIWRWKIPGTRRGRSTVVCQMQRTIWLLRESTAQ